MSQLQRQYSAVLDRPEPIANALLPFAVAACFVWLVAPMSVPVAAAVYVLAFVMLAWRRPELALMVTLASAYSQHSLPLGLPVHVSLGEANLALCLAVLSLRVASGQTNFRLSPVLPSIMLYLAVCVVVSVINWRGTTLTSLVQMGVYLIAAVIVGASFIHHARAARPALYAVVIAAVPLSIVLMFSDTQYILGLHKNGVGAGLAVGLIIATELLYQSWGEPRRRRILLGLCLVIGAGLILTVSRGAWLSAMVGIGIVLMMRGQYALTFRLAVVALPVVAIAWFSLPQDVQEYAFGFEEDRYNIAARHGNNAFAWSQFEQNPLIGVGVGLRNEFDATNVVLLTLAESGIPGLVAFLLVQLSVLWLMRRGVRAIRRDDPRFSLLVLAGALVAARFSHGMVDHYWSRGMLLVAWTMVGLATMAIFQADEEADAARQAQQAQAQQT